MFVETDKASKAQLFISLSRDNFVVLVISRESVHTMLNFSSEDDDEASAMVLASGWDVR